MITNLRVLEVLNILVCGGLGPGPQRDRALLLIEHMTAEAADEVDFRSGPGPRGVIERQCFLCETGVGSRQESGPIYCRACQKKHRLHECTKHGWWMQGGSPSDIPICPGCWNERD